MDRKGLTKDLIDMALSAIPDSLKEEMRIIKIIERKPGLDKNKLIRHLSYRGFNMETIIRIVNGET